MARLIENKTDLLKFKESSIVIATTGGFAEKHDGHTKYLKKVSIIGEKNERKVKRKIRNSRKRYNYTIVLLHGREWIQERKNTTLKITEEERIKNMEANKDIDYYYMVNNLEELYEIIELLCPSNLVLSVTTGDKETRVRKMLELFRDKMQIHILGAQSKIHSTDIRNNKNL